MNVSPAGLDPATPLLVARALSNCAGTHPFNPSYGRDRWRARAGSELTTTAYRADHFAHATEGIRHVTPDYSNRREYGVDSQNDSIDDQFGEVANKV